MTFESIGLAIATSLAQEGARVVINSRSADSIASALEHIRGAVPNAVVEGFTGDLASAEEAERLFQQLSSVDILINNLGIYEPKTFEDISDEDWRRFFEVNVLSGIRLSRAYLPGMKKRNWGRIIFISSESGINIPVEMIHYGMTKTAMLAVSRGIAETCAGTGPDNLRYTKMALNNGSGAIPALGFGTLIPDPVATKTATKAALEAGFRQLDTAERYRTEKEVGEAMQEVFKAGKIKREDVFVATKLWNNNHRPERVKPAFEASLKKLQLDYVDLYLIHTPFAFQPGDEQDPRDANGNVIYDKGVTLLDTWRALEGLVDEGKCKAIGLSDVSLEQVKEIFEAARIKPAVVHVESHPYLPNGTFWTIAERMASCCKLSRRWGIVASPSCWKILSSPLSPSESTRPRRKSCSPGPSSAGRPS
jgi:diketogulonate reductase-like aldo/keto reductase